MHRCSTDEAPQHQYCPAGANSRCKWQQVQAGTRPSYEHKPAIPKAVFDVLKPIYVTVGEATTGAVPDGCHAKLQRELQRHSVEHVSKGRLLRS